MLTKHERQVETSLRATCASFLGLAILLFAGCGRGPRDTVKEFVEDCTQQKFDEAKTLCTLEAGQQVEMVRGLATMFKGSGLDGPTSKFIFVGQKIDGDKASVSYRPAENAEAKTVNLEKINGKWLVSSH